MIDSRGANTMNNRPSCRKCHQTDSVNVFYDIKADSTKQFFWFCEKCKCLAVMGNFLPHASIVPRVEALPEELRQRFWRDRLRNDNSTLAQCCVCGANGAQLHHFAPQSLVAHFGNEWHNWPTAYLCLDHHRQWHEIVTWYMPGYKQKETEFLQKYYAAVGA